MTPDAAAAGTPDRTRPPGSSRERLIRTAATLFQEEGYGNVSVGRVLSESGVCRSNFYYHFPSKEDLAVSVMDAWFEDLGREVIEPVLSRDDLGPFDRIRRIVDGLIFRLEENGCRGGCPFGTLANSEAEHNERFRTKLVEIFDAFGDILEGLYTEALHAGELRSDLPGGPRKLASGTMAFIQGGYVLTKTYAGSAPLRIASSGWLEMLAAEPRIDPPA